MKVALVHDYIKEYGGAERVLEALHEIWPKAPVFTTVYLPQYLGPHSHRFTSWDIRTSSLQNLPLVEKLLSPIRVLTPAIFSAWDFSKYDVVIVSATGAYFPNMISKGKALHVCYCHTPPRYLYGYPTARNWKKHWWGRTMGTLINHKLLEVDFLASQRPDFYIANSEETKRRIEKFYRRDAEVIYPPVSLASRSLAFSVQQKKKKLDANFLDARRYYLTGGRLARAKHIDLAVRACNRLELPLKVFGKPFADYGEELRKIAGKTIEFLGEVSDEKLSKVYRGAKALIYPSEAEDFGIMPVEAMATGIPVIAYRDGGVKETVIDAHSASSGQGPTGVFFDQLSADAIIKAIKQLDKLKINPKDCIDQASKFSKERFKREIKRFVNAKLDKSIKY